MNMISVSESALDSLKRMGEADKARIAELEKAIETAANLFSTHGLSNYSRHFHAFLRVNTHSQSIVAEGE